MQLCISGVRLSHLLLLGRGRLCLPPVPAAPVLCCHWGTGFWGKPPWTPPTPHLGLAACTLPVLIHLANPQFLCKQRARRSFSNGKELPPWSVVAAANTLRGGLPPTSTTTGTGATAAEDAGLCPGQAGQTRVGAGGRL